MKGCVQEVVCRGRGCKRKRCNNKRGAERRKSPSLVLRYVCNALAEQTIQAQAALLNLNPMIVSFVTESLCLTIA